jgi:nuclear pore complex protein Nup107
MVLATLPPELASIGEPEERAIEYLHYRQFFNIWDVFDRVVECQALEVVPMSKDNRSSWVNDYKVGDGN